MPSDICDATAATWSGYSQFRRLFDNRTLFFGLVKQRLLLDDLQRALKLKNVDHVRESLNNLNAMKNVQTHPLYIQAKEFLLDPSSLLGD